MENGSRNAARLSVCAVSAVGGCRLASLVARLYTDQGIHVRKLRYWCCVSRVGGAPGAAPLSSVGVCLFLVSYDASRR